MTSITRIAALGAVCVLAGCATPALVHGVPPKPGMPADPGEFPSGRQWTVTVPEYTLLVSPEVNSLPAGGVRIANASAGPADKPGSEIEGLLNQPVQRAVEDIFLRSARTMTKEEGADLVCSCSAAIEGVHAEEVFSLLEAIDLFGWFGTSKEYRIVIDCAANVQLTTKDGLGVGGGFGQVHYRVPLETVAKGQGQGPSSSGSGQKFEITVGASQKATFSRAALVEAVREAVQAAVLDALSSLPEPPE